MEEEKAEGFSEWAILELMGHRRLGGLVTEAEIGGIPFLRIDVYRGDGTAFSQFYGKAAVYALTPTTEEIARAASKSVGGPISRWELRAELRAGDPVGPAGDPVESVDVGSCEEGYEEDAEFPNRVPGDFS